MLAFMDAARGREEEPLTEIQIGEMTKALYRDRIDAGCVACLGAL